MRGAFSETEAKRFLDDARIPMRLAAMSRAGAPIVTSMWFLRRDDALYCASPRHAKVVARLQAEPTCGFEIAADRPPYRGVRGIARAELHPEDGAEILELLLNRYLGDKPSTLRTYLMTRKEHEVAIRLVPSWLRGWDYTDRMWDAVSPAAE